METINLDDAQNLLHPNNLHLLKAVITNLFKILDLKKQAYAFNIFLQKNHNNPFIDTITNENVILTITDNYDEQFDFLEATLSDAHRSKYLYQVIESIDEPVEILRLFTILLAIGGTRDDMDNYFELTTKYWEKHLSFIKRYSALLLKTKVDILIYLNKYFEAAEIAERVYSLFELDWENEKVGWLKYQYAQTLLTISKQVKLIIDVQALSDSLEKLKENAEWEDQMNFNF